MSDKQHAISSIIFQDVVSQPSPTNHVFIVDVSGSMYSTLPKIREHLKNNLAGLVKENDTVSLLYFASKGKYGQVFVGEPIRSLTDLTHINNQIDRFIKPMGCTGFVEPLNLAIEITKQLPKENINSLIFMTDGYDNEWSDAEILSVSTLVNKHFDQKTIIEYGWYCNHDLLVKMAEAMAAVHVFTENYSDYEPEFEKTIQQNGAKRKQVDLTGWAEQGADTALYRDNGKMVMLKIDGDKVFVPENIDKIWVTGRGMVDQVDPEMHPEDLLVLLYYALFTNDAKAVWKILSALGDVNLVQKYSTTFSKQDHINLVDEVLLCINDVRERFKGGRVVGSVPDENAPTIFDVLNLLVDSDVNIITNANILGYQRGGVRRTQREDDTEDKLADLIAETKDKEERKRLALQLAENESWTPEFIADDILGITSINTLVYNSSRPNINIQTSLDGTVPVPEHIREQFKLPELIRTHIYRNYTVVRDGIVNMRSIPVLFDDKLTAEIIDKLVEYGCSAVTKPLPDGRQYLLLRLDYVPLMNLSMVQDLNGKEFAEQHFRLQELKARQKVLKFYRDEIVGKVNAANLAKQYGDEAAALLSSKGIRDYGFSPLTDAVEPTDFYLAKEFNVKIKGLSSLPSVAAVLKKIEGKKNLNLGDQLMAKMIKSFTQFRESDMVKSSSVGQQMLETFIKDETKAAIDEVRALNKELSRVLYAVVVGRAWFSDVDFQNPVVEIKHGDDTVQVTFELTDTEVKI